MSKGARIETYVQSLGLDQPGYEACYLAYFSCFNTEDYYEAHDVLEHLWLRRHDENHAFYKGLIQLAGSFVHLKKQHERPWHLKDGRRLHPAVRLFALAKKNLAAYAPVHLGLDVEAVLALMADHVFRIEAADFHINPWQPGEGPKLLLQPASSGESLKVLPNEILQVRE